MSVLFVTDPLAGLDAAVDASVGLMAATQRLGEDVWVCGPEDLTVREGRVLADAPPTQFFDNPTDERHIAFMSKIL